MVSTVPLTDTSESAVRVEMFVNSPARVVVPPVKLKLRLLLLPVTPLAKVPTVPVRFTSPASETLAA